MAAGRPAKPPTRMDVEHAFKRRDWDPALVERVQRLCLRYPGVVEAEQFGGPWWKAGTKPFCFYGAPSERRADGHHGVDGVGLKLPLLVQGEVVKDPRFAPDKYIGRHGWTVLRFTGLRGEWEEVADLADTAYRGVASRRMLEALGPP